MIRLNQNGCPANVRFRIIEQLISHTGTTYEFADSYTSIIGVQNYIDKRAQRLTRMQGGLPLKCRFYLISANHRDGMFQDPEMLWKEALTIKELVEYLDD